MSQVREQQEDFEGMVAELQKAAELDGENRAVRVFRCGACSGPVVLCFGGGALCPPLDAPP